MYVRMYVRFRMVSMCEAMDSYIDSIHCTFWWRDTLNHVCSDMQRVGDSLFLSSTYASNDYDYDYDYDYEFQLPYVLVHILFF